MKKTRLFGTALVIGFLFTILLTYNVEASNNTFKNAGIQINSSPVLFATGLDAVDFIDLNNGWAVGHAGVIYHTTNGGLTWEKQNWAFTDDPLCILRGVDFIDQSNGWAVGHISGQATIIQTLDGGANWQVQSIFPEYEEFSSVEFLDSNSGWVTVSYPNNQTILHSIDGGNSWNISLSGGGGNNLFDIDFTDLNNGIAVGGKIWHTSDGGANWNLQNNPIFDVGILYGLEFISPNNAWAVSNMGHILHTLDGGNNWQVQFQVPDHSSIEAVEFVDMNNGWVVGSHIMHTTNGGTIWEVQKNYADYLRDVEFIDANNGWAVGEIYVAGTPDPNEPGQVFHGMATILHTSDGGQHWDLQLSPSPTPTPTTTTITPLEVGGETYSINKVMLIVPIILLLALLSGGVIILRQLKKPK